jgi:molybdopterin-containing oxidoreductase family iron-sulfur binding subunit
MNPRKDLSSELADLRERLGAARGKKYWRTLEELADTEAFQELMRREFPEQAAVWPDALSRRGFLALMGASLGLAGVSGCSVKPAPSREIVPYVRAPEEVIPGRPLFYATAMALGGRAVGLLVENHLGRPTKVEGNPDHPASGNPADPLARGATDIFSQASVLTLYDPDRSQTVTRLGQAATWDEALAALRGAVGRQRPGRGAGLRVLTETVVSPTLGQQLEDLLKEFPDAKWHQYEPLAPDAAHRAALLAYGEPVNTYYDFTKADVVLALDADFLGSHPGNLRPIADFVARRRVRTDAAGAPSARMNRLYAVETAVTCTGAKADNRLALPAGAIEGFAHAVAARLGVAAAGGGAAPEPWVSEVAADLERHRGRCLVLAGDRQPSAVHLLAHALNHRLGNVGQTVFHTAPVEARPDDQLQSLRELVEDMDRERVEVLLILGGNPVFTAPADFAFAERMRKVRLRVHLSLYQDETSRLCHWHLPEAHYLEAWGDARAFDGTASIAQPLIQPLYQGRSALEVLAALTDRLQTPGYEIVRDYWRKHWQARMESAGDFEQLWQTALHDGVVAGTRLPAKSYPLQGGWEKHLREGGGEAPAGGGYELVFQADPTIYDGRFANNGWLQELPKPLTKLTWDNAALVSPATARELGVGLGPYAHGGEHGGFHQDVLELRLGDRTLRAPVWIMPGHADRAITLSLGYGREYAGKVGGGDGQTVGVNAYALRTSDRPWFAPGLTAHRTGERYLVACTQQHHLMEGREPVRVGTLGEYHDRPRFAAEAEREPVEEEVRRVRRPLTMYRPHEYTGHKWGMAIDLTACVGCNACVVACQAENNIPVVGKEQVAAGREMHWLRIDRYLEGPAEAPREWHFQPVPCMHCENAPCEYVCPVEATVHSADGLNDMIYNRCVGTRFCSNNCPYKVRRFNFFFYADYASPSLRQQYNPDVTVRSRGVMEKCTYCVQRIRHAEIDADKEGRPIADGEVLTACQAACPAGAIVFGDINDRASTVKRWKDSPLHYALLADLNTQPRTTYLAALRNPNPALEAK